MQVLTCSCLSCSQQLLCTPLEPQVWEMDGPPLTIQGNNICNFHQWFCTKNPVSYSGVLGLPRALLSEKCSVSCKDSKGWIMLHILWLIFFSIIISVKLKISLAHTTQQISKEQVVASCNWNWYIMPYLPSRISDGCTRQILSLCTSIWSLKVYRYNTLSWK